MIVPLRPAQRRSRTGRWVAGWTLVAASSFLGAFLFGCGSKDDPQPGGHTYGVRSDGRGWAVSDEGLFGHRRVPGKGASTSAGLGYAQGSESAPSSTGVLIRKADRMAPGLNLMNSGDAAEAVLMSSFGEVEHRWALPYADHPDAPPLDTAFQIPWRRVHLQDDGSLFAIHSDAALIYLDRDSRLIWALYDRIHHDLDVQDSPDGPSILALSRCERIVPAVNPAVPVLDDLLVRVNAQGEKVLELSLWDAFTASEWAPMLERLTEREGDVMHANSVDVLDPREAAAFQSTAVQAGDVLVCMRDLDIVCVVSLSQRKMVWMTLGPAPSNWRGSHDPEISSDGEILIFDNLGGIGGHSRLLSIAPGALRSSWTWTGTPAESFSSQFCGTVDELPGGNVLATESCHGRAIEIDRETGEIVWEYVSDRLAGEDDELVAALFEVQRIERPKWLAR